MNVLTAMWGFAYAVVVLGLSIYGIHRFWMIFAYLRAKKKEIRPAGHFAEPPFVTIQLPVYNERYVVGRLIAAVAAVDYPRDRFEVQVLDDSTDDTSDLVREQVEALRAGGLQIEHLRRTNRIGFKAGALQYGLEHARGEIVAVFDADFLPPANILRDTVDYFVDPKIGMIQTRWGHLNRGYNLLTRVQALLLDGHLLIEQTARCRSGRFFNFNGTAGLWRTSCIKDAGGWEHDTLTEDLDLSYRAQLNGWKFVFLPQLITPAELPVDMNAFKTQQHRWAKGAIQTCKKLLPRIWSSPLPWKVKLEAIFHLTSNFAYLLLALLAFLTIPTEQPAGMSWWSVLTTDMPIFTLASVSVFLFYSLVLHELGARWWQFFLYLPALIAVGIGLSINNARAVLEAVFNHESEFARTPKYGISSKSSVWHTKRYADMKVLTPGIEMALACYYAYFVWFAIDRHLWASIPFLLLFLAGFSYVALSSIFQRPVWLRWLDVSARPEQA
jgi:cellulose synthase/poly-beta-1,6-N-acetylglucosamine synthase-like glycosyltransferase